MGVHLGVIKYNYYDYDRKTRQAENKTRQKNALIYEIEVKAKRP